MHGFKIGYFDRVTLANLYREIFVRQHYLFASATASPRILDCGANLGMATLYFKWLYPQARIQAFEPDPTTFALLEKNVSQNHLRDVTLHNCALWNEEGQIEFFIDQSIAGSLLMSTQESRLKGSRPIRVPSRRLSDYIEESIDFLKLDVEGAEHQVLCDLLGSGKAKLIRQMVIEYHHRLGDEPCRLSEFLGHLEQAGFAYQIHASLFPVTSKGVFQDMLIGAYRETANG
jgi:FkbM family methyltransferase